MAAVPSIRTISQLEELVCQRLKLQFEEVRSDAELDDLVNRYVRRGEAVFCTLLDDLDAETYATLIRLKNVERRDSVQYVAVIDCRGSKESRRFFSRWHEIAHLLTMTRQLDLYHRSTDKPPLERLMDHIAGEVGFFDPIFGPALSSHVARGRPLTFAAVDAIREEFCPHASFQSTLIACVKRAPSPILYIEAGLGLKRD